MLYSSFNVCSLGDLVYSQISKLGSIDGAVRAEIGMLVVAVVLCMIYTTLSALTLHFPALHLPALVCFVILMVGAHICVLKGSLRFLTVV